jgi:hypothetical protein
VNRIGRFRCSLAPVVLEQNADIESSVSSGEATELLRGIKASALGDHGAYARLLGEQKGWIEGTDSAGGFMVRPTVLAATCRRCARAPRSVSAARTPTSARTRFGSSSRAVHGRARS